MNTSISDVVNCKDKFFHYSFSISVLLNFEEISCTYENRKLFGILKYSKPCGNICSSLERFIGEFSRCIFSTDIQIFTYDIFDKNSFSNTINEVRSKLKDMNKYCLYFLSSTEYEKYLCFLIGNAIGKANFYIQNKTFHDPKKIYKSEENLQKSIKENSNKSDIVGCISVELDPETNIIFNINGIKEYVFELKEECRKL
jgi:hypothetical protein